MGDLGRNPLFAYMAGGVLTLGLKALAPASSATSLAWGGSFLVLALVAAAALVMDARKIWIKL